MSTTKQSSAQGKVNPVFSLSSGAFAGAVEGFATYPIEYTKTVAQFSTKAGEKVRVATNVVTWLTETAAAKSNQYCS